ncbi:hypothetical protein [Neosynechococcus sphagnicola]|uniref:hypothetical protein n=1 Tax=Neosynechococcus sphagnicola TaxID=1501145 RepID=UPI00138DD2A0|nr:hypothetical protein [Neosynechococcus sphagnicola]
MSVNAFNGSSWTGWSEVPGGGKTNISLSAKTFNGKLYLISNGVGENQVSVNIFNGSSWTGWSAVPGNGMTELPLASASFNGRLYIFGKASGGNQIYMNFLTP